MSVANCDISIKVLAQDHTDIGLVTLMPCSNVPSLQVLNKSFEWVEVENKDNDRTAIIVCVGEQMAFLSNYYYEPSRHRIVRSLGRSIETSIRVTKRSDTMPQ
jgi:isopenicillin N synthase-like dioxygenase